MFSAKLFFCKKTNTVTGKNLCWSPFVGSLNFAFSEKGLNQDCFLGNFRSAKKHIWATGSRLSFEPTKHVQNQHWRKEACSSGFVENDAHSNENQIIKSFGSPMPGFFFENLDQYFCLLTKQFYPWLRELELIAWL